jgi:tryptophan 2-monooxygenase
MQDKMPPAERGIFIAGDDVSWTPGWVEGAVQTALNAVWGIMHHLGGESPADNPGPGDKFESLKPLELPD